MSGFRNLLFGGNALYLANVRQVVKKGSKLDPSNVTKEKHYTSRNEVSVNYRDGQRQTVSKN